MPDALYNEAAKTESILDATNSQQEEKMIPKDLEYGGELAPREVMSYHKDLAFS